MTRATAVEAPSPETVPRKRDERRSLPRILGFGCLAGLFLAVAVEVANVCMRNIHTVVPGRVYRCAQLSGADLEALVRARGIRTVVNLRGTCTQFPWYLEESRTTHRLDISQEDINLSAGRYPSIHELRRVVEVLDHTEYPILVHCRHGADRTGLVSAVIMLLQPDCTLAQAQHQMSLRFGHIALGRPANLDRFLELYASWLHRQAKVHCGASFREWIAGDECPGEYACRIEPLELPTSIPRGTPVGIRIRAHNTGNAPWHLHAGTNAGVHACFTLRDDRDHTCLVGRAGLFDEQVAPGESIDLTLAIPAQTKPGRYHLMVDMVDEPHCVFHQLGRDPLDQEIIVRQDD